MTFEETNTCKECTVFHTCDEHLTKYKSEIYTGWDNYLKEHSDFKYHWEWTDEETWIDVKQLRDKVKDLEEKYKDLQEDDVYEKVKDLEERSHTVVTHEIDDDTGAIISRIKDLEEHKQKSTEAWDKVVKEDTHVLIDKKVWEDIKFHAAKLDNRHGFLKDAIKQADPTWCDKD